ncbi:pentatricopeptide repeat-containing protein At2g13600 [Cryptomeria japonica]|uniref:pentatricopeptide repeat-containing protein At2g13600 n=1 Tax=Cryptomeria japonica TaxID=3369 RepID=UPI0027DA6614|nr:pentatricopeptide repeat-containing protein At2g13600 [Cryptomeria japonica]XP_057868347.2 pentatricopeptide repeat-containing protein At2g13600 [Cryptomeria japonica]
MNRLHMVMPANLVTSITRQCQTHQLGLAISQGLRCNLMFAATFQSNTVLQDYPIQDPKENHICVDIDKVLDAPETIDTVYQQDISINICSDRCSSLLQECTKAGSLEDGKVIHGRLIKCGIMGKDIFLENKVLNMYAKCNCFQDARQMFDKMLERNIVSWTALISGYVQHGNAREAFELFHRLQWTGISANQYTFGSILSAAAAIDDAYGKCHMVDGCAVRVGRMIHGCTVRTGFESDVIVGNALVAMYMKSNKMDDAYQVFDKMPERDVVSWNSLIAGYARSGYVEDAIKFVHEMQRAGVRPDHFTFVNVLGVCQNIHDLQHGKQVHGYSIIGFMSDIVVNNALITMYIKCGCLEDGRKVFDKLPDKSVVSWTAMISGYVQQCLNEEAIESFWEMLQARVKPNHFTLSSVLRACGSLAALEHGRQVHSYAIRDVAEFTAFVRNTLITMYSECGSIGNARKIFEKMRERELVTWNAMIGGYAQHGYGKEALKLFETMRRENMQPDPVTFVGVLSACSHEGLVDEGRCFFEMMSRTYGIFPGVGHYACMVDILGRAGHFNEAENLIKNMPFEPDAAVWGALMGACRIHGNLELGKHAAEWLYVLEPENTAAHVLLSQMYATAGKWDDAARVRKSMRNRGLQKRRPGCSWIEVGNEIHSFIMEDR